MQKYDFDLIIISDRAATGERPDQTIPAVKEWTVGKPVQLKRTVIIPDRADDIRREIIKSVAEEDCPLVITSGGTGFARSDITPEVTREIIEKFTPGIDEYLRQSGMEQTIYAALSRGVSGIISNSLVINLPGNPGAVIQNLETLLKILPHAIKVLRGPVSDREHKQNLGNE